MPAAGPFVDTTALILVALLAFASPLAFLGLVIAAAIQRSRSGQIGPGLGALVAASGGMSLGALVLVDAGLLVELPIYAAIAIMVASLWRRGRRGYAGWLLAGAALPWTLLWGYCALLLVGGAAFDEASTLARLLSGGGVFVLGLVVALRGDPAPPAPDNDAPAGQPGSRSFGSITAAIREPSLVGPFGMPEIAMLVAIVVTALAVPFLIPGTASPLLRTGITALAVAIIGTEAYIWAWPSRSRRAFEAFSWVGEAQAVREVTAARSHDVAGAERRLARARAARETGIRIQLLLLVNRVAGPAPRSTDAGGEPRRAVGWRSARPR
jgi:hypothetical protein